MRHAKAGHCRYWISVWGWRRRRYPNSATAPLQIGADTDDGTVKLQSWAQHTAVCSAARISSQRGCGFDITVAPNCSTALARLAVCLRHAVSARAISKSVTIFCTIKQHLITSYRILNNTTKQELLAVTHLKVRWERISTFQLSVSIERQSRLSACCAEVGERSVTLSK